MRSIMLPVRVEVLALLRVSHRQMLIGNNAKMDRGEAGRSTV